MIRLPLSEYTYRPPMERPDIVVEPTDADATVNLIVELEPGEMAPVRRATPEVNAHLEAHLPSPWASERTELVDILAFEIIELRRDLDQARCERDVTRRLLPDEARALAAMLNHFADEVMR